jgi:WS/DGAT/MGAT family acyltransferase
MKHLSGLDSLFLAMEQGNQYMHVAGVGIYDPSTAPGGKVRFKSVLNFFSEQINRSRVFRRRLVVAPMGLDRPYWIEDAEVDIEYHVRHISLPHPGDWRQLMIQVARIHSRPLDMTKPLWESYIIEGLDNIPGIPEGSFAMYTKFHHSAVDGEAGAALIKALHSLSPVTEDAAAGAPIIVADRDPTRAELYAHAVSNRAKQVFDGSRLLMELGSRAVRAGADMVVSGKAAEMGVKFASQRFGGKKASAEEVAGSKDLPRFKVHTRFDNDVSAHRVVDAVGFSLADCRKIRQHVADVTINDIFLAATSGAIRKYLVAKGELPVRTLNAMMPISTRGTLKDANAGNQIGMSAIPLRTDIADPLECLLAVRRGTGKSKALNTVLGKDLPMKVLQILPASVAERILRMTVMAMSNVVVSNVRGPDEPMYMAGAQLVLFLPVSIAFTGIGLNITGFSYNGTLWVCFVSCREMIPDPQFFSQCLDEAFEDLVTAAIARGGKKRANAAPVKTAIRKTTRRQKA